MDSRHYWEDSGHPVKYENYNSNDGFGRQSEGNLNFATGALHSEDEGDYISSGYLKKGKVARQDPMSHRIIEKRRRDRMNNCLADLSRLIPPDYLKKGRGRVEKTEIIEMAIRHLKYLQERANAAGGEQRDDGTDGAEGPISKEHFRLGYQECRSEVMRYLVEGQGHLPTDSLCVSLVGHLNRHCDSIMKGDQLNKPRSNPETTSSSSGSSNNNYSGVAQQTVIAQTQRSITAHEDSNTHDYHKREHYGPPQQSYAPSPEPCDDYITFQQETEEPLPLIRNLNYREPTLRNVRKLEQLHEEYSDHINYKYKNTIKQRFSEEKAYDMSLRQAKRRRPHLKENSAMSADTSMTSNDEGVCPDASSDEPLMTDESRIIPPHLTPEPPPLPTLAQVSNDIPHESKISNLCVPVFALNAIGKYYVPLNISYDCLSSFLGPYNLLDGKNTMSAPLHPVSINVNFQPYLERMKPKIEGKVNWCPV